MVKIRQIFINLPIRGLEVATDTQALFSFTSIYFTYSNSFLVYTCLCLYQTSMSKVLQNVQLFKLEVGDVNFMKGLSYFDENNVYNLQFSLYEFFGHFYIEIKLYHKE